MWGLIEAILPTLETIVASNTFKAIVKNTPFFGDYFSFFKATVQSASRAAKGMTVSRITKKSVFYETGIRKGMNPTGRLLPVDPTKAFVVNMTRLYKDFFAKNKLKGVLLGREVADKLHKNSEELFTQLHKDKIITKDEWNIIKKLMGLNKEDLLSETKVSSSWIESIAWTASLSTLHVKLKDGTDFVLPFFPRALVDRMLKGESAGETLWLYWRAMGRGGDQTKNTQKIVSSLTPTKQPTIKFLSSARVTKPGVSIGKKGVVSLKIPKLKI